MARLKIKRRTQAIDDAREVKLGTTPEGEPIWTTAGENRMTGDDKAALSANLKSHHVEAIIQKNAEGWMQFAAQFIEQMILGLMPKSVYDDYRLLREGRGGRHFARWMEDEGFEFKRDGLTIIVLKRGKVLGKARGHVASSIAIDVMRRLDVMKQ